MKKGKFTYVNNMLNLLVVDNDPHSAEETGSLFSNISVYNVYTANTMADAVSMLKSQIKIHACIMELGLRDLDNDEYYILNHFRNFCPVMVFTKSDSPESGAKSILFGAREVVDKRESCDRRKLVEKVNVLTIKSILNPGYNNACNETIDYATKLLFEKKPQTVTKWAEYLKITDRQLRNIWKKEHGHNAKSVLTFHNIFTCALKFHVLDKFDTKENVNVYLDSPDARKYSEASETFKKCISEMLLKQG